MEVNSFHFKNFVDFELGGSDFHSTFKNIFCIKVLILNFSKECHYLQNKVGVVDFTKARGPFGPLGFCKIYYSHFILEVMYHYLQEYSKIWNIAKSNKSELRNRLSYRGLPYIFEVRSQTFRNNCKISRSQTQNSTLILIQPQRPRKAQVRI